MNDDLEIGKEGYVHCKYRRGEIYGPGDPQTHEVASYYVDPRDRYVVSLVVSCSDSSFGQSIAEWPEIAVARALTMGHPHTHWHVYDRKTGVFTVVDQSRAGQLIDYATSGR